MIKKTNKGTTMDTGDRMAENLLEKAIIPKVQKVKIKKPDAKPVGTWYISGNYKRFTNG